MSTDKRPAAPPFVYTPEQWAEKRRQDARMAAQKRWAGTTAEERRKATAKATRASAARSEKARKAAGRKISAARMAMSEEDRQRVAKAGGQARGEQLSHALKPKRRRQTEAARIARAAKLRKAKPLARKSKASN